MWCEPELLSLCEKLKHCGRQGRFRPGTRIARGFADVGFEEFVLLPNGKSMSLFAGTQAEFLEEHRGFFFEVPTIADLLSELELRGEKVVAVEYVNQRNWRVRTSNQLAECRDLQEALVRCLIASYESHNGRGTDER